MMRSKYITEWQSYVMMAEKMLNEDNLNGYTKAMNLAEQVVKEYQKKKELTYECKNFGMCNYIFEDALPTLFKTNKQAVKEFIQTIKEDKNLLNQFKFFKALEEHNKSFNSKQYVNEVFDLTNKLIDKKTINESNVKLCNLIKKYDITPSKKIDADRLKFFESCNFVFTNDKKLTNLSKINNNINLVCEFVESNYNNDVIEEKINFLSLIEDFNKKYDRLLNEDERSLVADIMAVKEEVSLQRKENLFNKFKNECLNIVDKMLSEDVDDKEGLEAIKESIQSKTFNNGTLVQDIAKLLEIKEILVS